MESSPDTALAKYLEAHERNKVSNKVPTLDEMKKTISELKKELEAEKVAHIKTISDYELRIADLHNKYEQKLSNKIKEESDKLREELRSSFVSEETVRLKEVLATKEEQIISQLKIEIAEKLKKQIYSQECSRAYDNLKNQLTEQIKSQLESEYKCKFNAELYKVQQESKAELQHQISTFKQQYEERLSKHVEALNMESIVHTERERERIQRKYKQ